MKKLFLVAALGVAGLMSASNLGSLNANNIKNKISFIGGYCHIDVYRINADGSQTYVGSWGGYAESESACNSKGRSITLQLSLGITPEKVVY